MGSLSDTPVAIAIVGAGVIGKKHAQAITDCRTAHLAAVVDPTPAGQVLADSFSSKHFDTVQSMLASSITVEGAIICTPNETHGPIAQLLASAGIHLLIEKPLVPTASEGQSLLAHCQQNDVKVCVGHHRRHNPRIIAAKKSLVSGSIGQVVGCAGMWATLKPLSYFTDAGSWRRSSTGGVVLINVIHEMDLLQHLVGRITRIYAEAASSTRGFEAEEGVALTLRFGNGAVGTFLALDNASSPYTFEQATGEFTYHPYTGQDTYRIFGRQGTLSVPKNEVWRPEDLDEAWHSQMKMEVVPYGKGEAFAKQLINFIDVIKGKAEPGCTGDDGLAAVKACEAIRTSLLEKRPVEI